MFATHINLNASIYLTPQAFLALHSVTGRAKQQKSSSVQRFPKFITVKMSGKPEKVSTFAQVSSYKENEWTSANPCISFKSFQSVLTRLFMNFLLTI